LGLPGDLGLRGVIELPLDEVADELLGFGVTQG
jgi:hypothetical protein